MMYQPTTENSPPDYRTVRHNRPRLRFDQSYLGTTLGVLKLVELISFAIASLVYIICVIFKHREVILVNFVNREPKSELEMALKQGYSFFKTASYLLGMSVNSIMWSYLYHVVERYHTIPWYIIEYIFCVVFGCVTIAAGGIAIRVYSMQAHNADTAFIFTALFSFIASLAFFYNLYVVHQRRTQKIPPQLSKWKMNSKQ